MIYRPPNTDISHFINTKKDTLDKIKNENKICYLVGDDNINLINIELHSLTSDLMMLCILVVFVRCAGLL